MNFIKRIFFKKSEIEIPRWFFLLGIILCVVGLANATYLTVEHFSIDDMICPFNGGFVDCVLVNTSIYSEIFNIPIAILGMLYYLTCLTAFIILKKIKKQPIFQLLSGLTFLGLLFSIWLTFAQVVILKAVCTYCLLSAFISLCLFVLDLVFILKNNFYKENLL